MELKRLQMPSRLTNHGFIATTGTGPAIDFSAGSNDTLDNFGTIQSTNLASGRALHLLINNAGTRPTSAISGTANMK